MVDWSPLIVKQNNDSRFFSKFYLYTYLLHHKAWLKSLNAFSLIIFIWWQNGVLLSPFWSQTLWNSWELHDLSSKTFNIFFSKSNQTINCIIFLFFSIWYNYREVKQWSLFWDSFPFFWLEDWVFSFFTFWCCYVLH